MSVPYVGPLFRKEGDHDRVYFDEACTLEAKLVKAGDSHIITGDSEKENGHISRPSPIPVHEGFNKEQTLFLIDMMRQHLDIEGDGLPKTLAELNSRLKHCKANKKLLWKEAAEKLSEQFLQKFCPEKVARKWNTLLDAYKKVKDNIKRTGKGAMRFQFYTEMDELLGGQHDEVFPVVVGSSDGLKVRRPKTMRHCTVTASSQPATLSSLSQTETPHKRLRVDEDLIRFLVRSEEATQRRHEEILAQMQSAQRGFEALMNRLLDKMP